MTLNMMQMVGIMVVCYLVTLTAICVYRKEINIKIGNAIFMIVDAAFFITWTYASYINEWTESGFMAFDNISPLTMTIIPLTVFMNKKARSYCESGIAFVWFGMFVALIVSPQHAYIFSDTSAASLGHTTEAACHLIASLYGVYLIITGQVKCNVESLKKAAVFLYSAIGIGVIANYLLHTSNFGMNPYGDYSIYMIDIFRSFEATLIAYLLGVFVVIVVGMQLGHLLYKIVSPEKESDNTESKETKAEGAEISSEEKPTACDTEDANEEDFSIDENTDEPEENTEPKEAVTATDSN